MPYWVPSRAPYWVIAILLFLTPIVVSAAETPTGKTTSSEAVPPTLGAPLIGHWTFDEADGNTCADAGPNGFAAKMVKRASRSCSRRVRSCRSVFRLASAGNHQTGAV